MKPGTAGLLLGLFIGGAAGAVIALRFVPRAANHGEEEEEGKEAEHESEPPRLVRRDGKTQVHLSAEEQQRAGLVLAALEPIRLGPEQRALARILDPAPLLEATRRIQLAEIALASSRKELDRLKQLASEQNTSARTLEAAGLQVEKDLAAVATARLDLAASWGREMAEREDLPRLAARLVAREGAIVRLDLPPGVPGPQPRATVALASEQPGTGPLQASIVGFAPRVDPQTLGESAFALAEGITPLPGTILTAWIASPGAERDGALVPRAAIVRHGGSAFVYVAADGEHFERREAALDRPLEKGWFAQLEAPPGTRIVVTGAQVLLSEELRGTGGEEEE